MWILYQLAMAAALVVAGPWLLLRRGGHHLETLGGRLGGYRGPVPAAPLWIHAVSVGEVGVAATLARALPAATALLVTTVTPTGQARARQGLGERAAVAYLPFDLGFAVGRFLDRFRPRALVLVEGDLWPLLLARVKRRGLPVVVINGRISDRSFRRLRRLRPLLGPLLSPVDRFAVQTAADRERLLALGVAGDRVEVTGNLKFDTRPPPPQPELEALVHAVADGRPLLVAGSTMRGEEEQVLDAFVRLGGAERALLLLAPRHPERWDEVEQLLAARGLATRRRSALETAGAETTARPAVVLLDSMGELAGLYRLADAVFIGGTLVPTGGHNPLEAARFGRPVAAGPSMENFREMAEGFDRAAAWQRVDDAAGLAETWERWLGEPEAAAALGRRGEELVASGRGALERTLALVEPLLAGGADQNLGRAAG